MADRVTCLDLLTSGKVTNVYQPVLEIRTGKILGFETLGRLQAIDRLIMPDVFLPHLDRYDLTILFFVSLKQTLSFISSKKRSKFPYWFSINISVFTLLEKDFVHRIRSLLDVENVLPSTITLELLESGEFFDLYFARNVLQALRDVGFSIAIDDLGTGFSSLSRLRDLPIDKVKLDRSFVRSINEKPDKLHFIAAMQTLARGLGHTMICEGVETADVLEAISVLDVDAVQGYIIAKPMIRESLESWIYDHKAVVRSPELNSLLGAYATHIKVVDVFIALRNQTLPIALLPEISDPTKCVLGQYIGRSEKTNTPVDEAHRYFHSVIECYISDPALWNLASSLLLKSIEEEVYFEAKKAITR